MRKAIVKKREGVNMVYCGGCMRILGTYVEGETVLDIPEACPDCGADVWLEEEQMGVIPED